MAANSDPLTVWVDAQLPPALARWLRALGEDAHHVEELDLLSAGDTEIFNRARAAEAVVLTKDHDFPVLLERLGPPPQVVWFTGGNVRNQALRVLIEQAWPRARALLLQGEALIEVSESR